MHFMVARARSGSKPMMLSKLFGSRYSYGGLDGSRPMLIFFPTRAGYLVANLSGSHAGLVPAAVAAVPAAAGAEVAAAAAVGATVAADVEAGAVVAAAVGEAAGATVGDATAVVTAVVA